MNQARNQREADSKQSALVYIPQKRTLQNYYCLQIKYMTFFLPLFSFIEEFIT
jgi:hypothetical protein